MPRWKQKQNQDRYKNSEGMSTEEIFGAVSGGIGALSGLASFGMGIDSMITARRKQAEAERKNKQLMDEAKRMAEKDFYAGVNVPLDAFNKQFEETLQQQQQSLQALQEGDARSVAAGVGRVGALAGEQGEKTRIALGEALYANNKMKADSKQSINQQGIDINVGMAQDESLRAKDANRQASQAMAGAQEGLASGLQGAAGMIPGYLQGRGDKLTSDIINQVGSMDVFKEVGLPEGFDATNEATRKMFTDNPLFNKLSNSEKKEMLLNLKGGKSSVIQDLASMIFDK
jgi:hypothetical protein|tara:strand:- start:1955 stop:2815 length:861 start_codon:yes stop_codon:yes gene_type:complete